MIPTVAKEACSIFEFTVTVIDTVIVTIISTIIRTITITHTTNTPKCINKSQNRVYSKHRICSATIDAVDRE